MTFEPKYSTSFPSLNSMFEKDPDKVEIARYRDEADLFLKTI